ncbi:MAG: YfcE family phosphodiesterase [Lawsonibacter sp.]
MKILVFSDSHRSWSGMIQAIDEQQPDQVIHLGDLISDAEEMSYLYPQIPICMVPGNCDGWTTVPAIKQITLQRRSILLSHGHLWGVKSGCDAAVAQARAVGADILLFGHTHQPLCQQLEDGLWVLNPGPSRSSCGVILLEDGLIRCSLIRLA